MLRRKLFISIVMLSFGILSAKAQERWSVQKCVDYALANSITIKQRDLQTLNSQALLNQSKLSQYPSLNGSSSYGVNSGRSVDRFTNQFIQQSYNFNSWGLNLNVPIYQGLQIRNGIKQGKLNVEANQYDTEQARQNVSLNTVLAYLNVLNTQEQLEVAKLQVATSGEQVSRTEKLVQAGSLPMNNLYDLQSQLANDQLNLVTAQNNLSIAKVNLMQAMNYPVSDNFEIEKVQFAEPDIQAYDKTAAQIYDIALGSQFNIKAANTRIESNKVNVKIAKGGLQPTVSGFGGLSTNYVSSAPSQQFVGDGTTRLIYAPVEFYNNADGTNKQTFYSQQSVPNGSSRDFTYFRQLDFNRSTNYGLSLQVPIFNGLQARTRISQATIQQKQAELTSDQAKIDLRQSIEQAYNSMVLASQSYLAGKEAVKARELSFTATKARFEAGLANGVDLSLAQTNLGRARADQVRAKYDYIFRTKVLDFYQNKPITF